MSDKGVAVGAAQVARGQPFEDLVRDTIGRVEGELQRRRIGDARAIDIAGRLAALLAEATDLLARAVDEHDADAEAAKQGDVLQQRTEIVVLDDGAVQRDDENAVAEARHVAQDLAQTGPAARCLAHPPHPRPLSPAGRGEQRL